MIPFRILNIRSFFTSEKVNLAYQILLIHHLCLKHYNIPHIFALVGSWSYEHCHVFPLHSCLQTFSWLILIIGGNHFQLVKVQDSLQCQIVYYLKILKCSLLSCNYFLKGNLMQFDTQFIYLLFLASIPKDNFQPHSCLST